MALHHDLMRGFAHGLVKEIHGFFSGAEQGFYFFAQIGIAGTAVVKKRGARFRLQIESLVKQGFESPPAIGRGSHNQAILQ